MDAVLMFALLLVAGFLAFLQRRKERQRDLQLEAFYAKVIEATLHDDRDDRLLLGVFDRFSEIEAAWEGRFDRLEDTLKVQESRLRYTRMENARLSRELRWQVLPAGSG